VSGVGHLPEEAYGAALLGLPSMNPRTLRLLLDGSPPSLVWSDLVSNRQVNRLTSLHKLSATAKSNWRAAARSTDVDELWCRCTAAGVTVLLRGAEGYPARLAGDAHAPAVLFAAGDVSVLEGPTATVVGTRRCTGYGAEVAWTLGRGLAAAGVVVVSGLAAGIDAAAHGGALSAEAGPPAGVGGSGIDVPYPAGNAGLWRAVTRTGVMLSEAPLGAAPTAWRFPERNRILASLGDVVVVVESHRVGGSMHTVEAAIARGKPVMAVPGPVTSPASEGCNALLVDGCAPARDVEDMLARIALERPAPPAPDPEEEPEPTGDDRVLWAVDPTPTMFETVLGRTGMNPVEAAAALGRLEAAGRVLRGAGWWERR